METKSYFLSFTTSEALISFKILILFFPLIILGQTPAKKEVNDQIQTWVSLNNNFKFNEHWGLSADFHVRRNNFVDNDSFYFVRSGINYVLNSNASVALGYGHMWVAPSKPGWDTFSNENRIYQQFQLNSKIGAIGIFQRLRNEQRWQQKIVNDEINEAVNSDSQTNRKRGFVSRNHQTD